MQSGDGQAHIVRSLHDLAVCICLLHALSMLPTRKQVQVVSVITCNVPEILNASVQPSTGVKLSVGAHRGLFVII